MLHFERFFTFWALACHVLFMLGLAPCTFILAAIVWVGSILHNVFLNPEYNFTFDFLLHHLPFALFLLLWQNGALTRTSILFSVTIITSYVAVNGGIRNVYKIYTSPKEAFQGEVSINTKDLNI